MPLTFQPILVPHFSSWDDARQVLTQQLTSLQQQLASQIPVVDFGGTRLSGVGAPQAQGDAVNLGYLLAVSSSGAKSSSPPGGLVGLSAPSEFTVSNSPVAVGTLTLGKATESANTVWAGPTSGGAAPPTFRTLVPGDLIAATGNQTGVVGSKNIVTFTPSGDGTFRVGGYVTITAIATDVLQLQLNWTDETGTSRTVAIAPQGVVSANLSAIGVYLFPVVSIRAKSGNAITLSGTLTLGTGSITYDAGGTIQQVST